MSIVNKILNGITVVLTCVCVSCGYAYAKEYECILYENDFESGQKLWAKTNAEIIDSPVKNEEHGKVIKTNYTTESDNFIGTDYSVITTRFESGKLKNIRIKFDIMFEDYISAGVRIIDSTVPTKYGTFLAKFTEKGAVTLANPVVTNEANKLKYSVYNLDTWYSYLIEMDIENGTYSLWINGDEITAGSNIVTTGGVMKDFLHWRIYVNKQNSGSDKYFYLDNIGYYTAYSEAYEASVIETEFTENRLNVKGIAPNTDSAVMIVGIYREGRLTEIKAQSARVSGDAAVAEISAALSEGSGAKCFLFKNLNQVRPLCEKQEYYHYSEDEYKTLIEKWRSFIVGGENIDTTGTQVANRINSIKNTALNLQNSMNKNADASSLWGAAYTASSHLTQEYGNIYKMALAWGTRGQSLYHDETLKTNIFYALEWMYENRYGQAEIDGTGWRSVKIFNWWDWFVGAPRYLIDTLIILDGEISSEDTEKYLSPFEYVISIMRLDTSLDSNVNSRAYNVFAAKALTRDEQGLKELTEAYSVLFETARNGTGMYEDYSYVKHNQIAYTGMYGTGALLDRIVQIMAVTADTPFEIPQMKSHKYEQWIYNAFEPLMVNGGIMSMVRGRGIEGSSEHSDGLTVFKSMLNMMDAVSDEDAVNFKTIIKKHLTGERLEYAYRNLTLPQIAKLEQIINDDSVPEAQEDNLSRIYYNMDRVVHHKKNYHAGIAMSSSRIANYESINHENMRGWYTGDGMLYIYTQPNQYNPDYFKYADPYKRPGTTVDTQERQAVSVVYGQEYFSSKDFVGGVSLGGKYAAAAMELEAFHNDTQKGVIDTGSGGDQPLHDCDLTAKKAWFLFDDEIVCMGADISASGSAEVVTIVENRKISDEAATVNGQSINDGVLGETENTLWAHIEGTGGYYFPQGGALSYRKTENNFKFFEMWLKHGAAPSNEKYVYIVLPGKTAEQTQQYVQNPLVQILCNNGRVQAVHQKNLGITGYVFWESGRFNGITVSAPLTVMTKSAGNEMELSFSDPTHKLEFAEITIDGEYEIKAGSKEVSAEINGGKTVLRSNIAGSEGKSIEVKLGVITK